MTITSMIRRALAKPTPKTYVAGGGKAKDLFSERKRTAHQLERYRVIYDQGGVVTEAINSYPLFLSTRGYRLEGPDPETAKVQEWLDESDFDGVVWDAVTDALIFGDAFQEIVLNRDGTPSHIVPRLASEFEIEHDEHDKVSRYVQRVIIDGKEKVTRLKPHQILHLQFWRASGSVYGHSLIHRAFDDIMRDVATSESSAQAVKRHGFKKYHIRVGNAGETIPQDVLKNIDKEFQDLESKNDFVTPADMEIKSIDEGGLEHIDTYNDVSLMRMSAALGVPEELLGMRRGSTDATAVKRIDTFFDKISAMQRRVARCYNLNIINRLTSRPGIVKLVFNEVNPDDETKRAAWITQVMKASADPFAILPQDWIKKQFTIDAATAKPEKKETKEKKEKKEKDSELGRDPLPNTDHGGLIVSAPHGELLWRGIQKAVVKTVSLERHVGEPLYLISNNLCYGLIRIDKEEILGEKEFHSRTSRHLMADDPKLKAKEEFFYYDVKLLTLFSQPRRCTVPERAWNYTKTVEFAEG